MDVMGRKVSLKGIVLSLLTIFSLYITAVNIPRAHALYWTDWVYDEGLFDPNSEGQWKDYVVKYAPPRWIDGELEQLSTDPEDADCVVWGNWCPATQGEPTYPYGGTLHLHWDNDESESVIVEWRYRFRFDYQK